MDQGKKVSFTRAVSSVGNGAMVRLHKADLEQIDAKVGTEVRVTIEPVSGSHEATLTSGRRMAARYARTLELLGK